MACGGAPRCAVIGLGSMGLGMALSLIRKGLPVTGFDLNGKAVEKLVQGGGTGASSVAEAAKDCSIALAVVVQLLASRTVTVYVPAARLLMFGVVALLDQR